LANFVYRIESSETNNEIFNEISKDATVVFVMNHRSNMDYVLVTYLAARDSALSYAVGEWARVWPLSWLIKSLGAYFIRRRSRGALYRKVLARYVQMATEGGVNQAFYPEGGLSLTGKLQPPKLGLMSYLVEGFDPEGARDVVFVPVAINYDRVLEDVVLIAAHERGDRRFGARISVVVGFILRKLWQRMTFQETRFGTAAVAFGPPLSLRAAGPEMEVRELSKELMSRISGVMPVLAVPAVCHVLLGRDGIGDAALREQAAALFDAVPQGNRSVDAEGRALEISRGIEGLASRKLIEQRDGNWYIVAGKQPLLNFYANSIAHFFKSDAAAAKDSSATAGS
jgi:glycerol-3-phosphate O-acyltransferase